jgi:hypothetical protein
LEAFQNTGQTTHKIASSRIKQEIFIIKVKDMYQKSINARCSLPAELHAFRQGQVFMRCYFQLLAYFFTCIGIHKRRQITNP